MTYMENTQQMQKPDVGSRLANGATVIAYTHLHDGGDGFRPHGIVLAMRGPGYHPYVVWRTYEGAPGQDEWECEVGNYFSNLGDALNCFTDRPSLVTG